MVLVFDRRVGWVLDKVVGLEWHKFGKEVAAGEREVLDDEIEVVVGVLDAMNGDVSNLRWKR